MKNFRDKYTRNTTSALSSHLDYDYVKEGILQPELTYNKFSTIFSSQLVPQIGLGTKFEDQQTARQRLREYINLKKINNTENAEFQSKEFQVQRPKHKVFPLKFEKIQKENSFNSLNLNSTQRTVNKLQDWKQLQKSLENQRIINLELKQETQSLRTQIYELRNVEIELQKIKIYVRKLQNELKDQANKSLDIKQKNQELLKKIAYFEDQLQTKLKESEILEIQLIRTKKVLYQLTQKKKQKNFLYLQQKKQKDAYFEGIQEESEQKSQKISELLGQISKLHEQIKEKQKENAEIYACYQESFQAIEQMQAKIEKMKAQHEQNQMRWETQVKKNENLFNQLEKVIEKKFKETKQTFKQLKAAKQESQTLKEEIEKLKTELQETKQEKQKNAIKEEQIRREYVPKKWFQEKIYYEYALNSLQNELQSLKQENEKLISNKKHQIKVIPQEKQENQISYESIPLVSSKTYIFKASQTQTQEINLGQIDLGQKSEKSRIIQAQFKKNLSLEKQIQKILSFIEVQKQIVEQKYQQKLREFQKRYNELQRKYNQEKQRLHRQKQKTQDLTMQLLIANQQVQESRVKIKSKQFL